MVRFLISVAFRFLISVAFSGAGLLNTHRGVLLLAKL